MINLESNLDACVGLIEFYISKYVWIHITHTQNVWSVKFIYWKWFHNSEQLVCRTVLSLEICYILKAQCVWFNWEHYKLAYKSLWSADMILLTIYSKW